MKLSAQDEYGLRILLRIAGADQQKGLSIPQLSEAEGLSSAYAGKLTRQLRIAGLIQSNRGQKGGYVLSRPPEEISIQEVIIALGGKLFDDGFCNNHSGTLQLCTNSVNCSVRSLWRVVQRAMDVLLEKITLQDLIQTETDSRNKLQEILEEHLSLV